MRSVAAFTGSVVVLALCVMAVFAVSGPAVETDALARQVPLPGRTTTVAMVVGLAAAVGVTLVALVAAVVRRRRRLFRRGGRTADFSLLALFAAGLAVAVLFTAFLALVVSFLEVEQDSDAGGLEGLQGEEQQEEEQTAEPELLVDEEPIILRERGPVGRYVLSGLGVVFAAVLAYLAVRHLASARRAQLHDEEDALRHLAEDLARSARIGLEEILAEPDHRKAVIAAYARMEEVFGRHGFPPERHQTPMEFMQAALSGAARLGGEGASRSAGLPRQPLLDLTRRYERAKFSLHEITAGDRGSALDSLRRIEAGLGAEG